ncbi:MAG: hypothetical protein KKF80_00235 [Candidatus Omnitrophica bacterium]|nr:hypothetical protein [Candidatus Omnitrophota bacterium]
MEIISYSERGIISSLFYEIMYSNNSSDKLNILWRLVKALSSNNIPVVDFNQYDIEILLEHSLSEFGSPEVVVLLNPKANYGMNHKIIIFIEGKVSAEESHNLKKCFDVFREAALNLNKIYNTGRHKGFASNLFVQLYHKAVLMDGLRNIPWGNMTQLERSEYYINTNIFRTAIKHRSGRKVGDNLTVHETVTKIKSHLDANTTTYYIGVVPKVRKRQPHNNEIVNQIEQEERNLALEGLQVFFESAGFIFWEDIRDQLCSGEESQLPNTKKVFQFNGEQICLG